MYGEPTIEREVIEFLLEADRVTARTSPPSWCMVATIARHLDLPAGHVDTVAEECARRNWVDHRLHHSVAVLAPGRRAAQRLRSLGEESVPPT